MDGPVRAVDWLNRSCTLVWAKFIHINIAALPTPGNLRTQHVCTTGRDGILQRAAASWLDIGLHTTRGTSSWSHTYFARQFCGVHLDRQHA
jgi:hypothetical protein